MSTPSRQHAMSRGLLVALAFASAWALIVWMVGGVEWRVGDLRISSRDPMRPALASLGLGLLYAATCWRRFADDSSWLTGRLQRQAGWIAGALAIGVAALAWSKTSLVAGGADPYGYVSQAYLWRGGDLTIPQPFARDMPWPFADLTFAPLGYRPAPGGAALVPTYAPGLPMLMALLAMIAGDCGPFVVVPLLGGVLVWLTYGLGRTLSMPGCGLLAAILLATSPAFLNMLMWPMSDVPVSTFWVGAVVAAISRWRMKALGTGLLMSAAILVRPNLAPLALPLISWLIMNEAQRADRVRSAAWVSAGLLPGLIAVAVIHSTLYGAPWKSGYGDLDTLYAWSHLAKNLARYPRWLIDTQTPLVLASIVPVAGAVRRRLQGARPEDAPILLLAAVILGVWASYLAYVPFDDWWYLRFLLPAFPLMLLLAVVGWTRLLVRLPEWQRTLAIAALVIFCVQHQVARARAEPIFRIGEGEGAYIRVAGFVAGRLPANAVLLSMQHSGSLRYYAGRPTLRYDWLVPEWWPKALDVLAAKGFRPFIVLEEWEEPLFRQRFASVDNDPLGCLVARDEGPGKTRIYDPLREHCGPLRIGAVTGPLCRPPMRVRP